MTRSWRCGIRAAIAAAPLLAAAACHRHEGGRAEARRPVEASQPSSPAERTVEGWVVAAGEEEVVIRQGTGGERADLQLLVDPQTKVTVRGRERNPADLQEGTRVRAAYDASGGLLHATRIDALGGGDGPR